MATNTDVAMARPVLLIKIIDTKTPITIMAIEQNKVIKNFFY